MNPVFFPQHNKMLTGPEGIADQNIIPLPVLCDGEVCYSMWEPNAEELAALNAGGAVLVGIYSGATQPPISVAVSPKE